MVEILSLVLSAFGVGFGAWQYRRAAKAEAAQPGRVAAEIARLLEPPRPAGTLQSSGAGAGAEFVGYADVTGDGRPELLIQYALGAHGLVLKVFGWHNFEFRELGEIGSNAGAAFEIGDTDGDGRVEIVSSDIDWSSGLPGYRAPCIKTAYRWNGKSFEPVGETVSGSGRSS